MLPSCGCSDLFAKRTYGKAVTRHTRTRKHVWAAVPTWLRVSPWPDAAEHMCLMGAGATTTLHYNAPMCAVWLQPQAGRPANENTQELRRNAAACTAAPQGAAGGDNEGGGPADRAEVGCWACRVYTYMHMPCRQLQPGAGSYMKDTNTWEVKARSHLAMGTISQPAIGMRRWPERR